MILTMWIDRDGDKYGMRSDALAVDVADLRTFAWTARRAFEAEHRHPAVLQLVVPLAEKSAFLNNAHIAEAFRFGRDREDSLRIVASRLGVDSVVFEGPIAKDWRELQAR